MSFETLELCFFVLGFVMDGDISSYVYFIAALAGHEYAGHRWQLGKEIMGFESEVGWHTSSIFFWGGCVFFKVLMLLHNPSSPLTPSFSPAPGWHGLHFFLRHDGGGRIGAGGVRCLDGTRPHFQRADV